MIRTKPCKKCGEVTFTINSTCGDVEFVCSDCKTVNTVNIGQYSTVKNTCDSCSNDIFKLRVSYIKDHEEAIIECTKCRDTPAAYYVDKHGTKIDRISREMLIIQDGINDFNSSVVNLESRINKVEANIEYIKHDVVENLSTKVNDSKLDINNINYEVSTFSDELNTVKNMVKNIERNIVSSLYLFK